MKHEGPGFDPSPGISRLDAEDDSRKSSTISASDERCGGHRSRPTRERRAHRDAEGDTPICRDRRSSGEEMMKYTVIYERGPSSWGAYIPDLPGVISVGDSREEVEQLIHEAVELHLEGLRQE